MTLSYASVIILSLQNFLIILTEILYQLNNNSPNPYHPGPGNLILLCLREFDYSRYLM